MAVDLTNVNLEQTPYRTRLISKHLKEVDTGQFDILDPTSQVFYDYVYDNTAATPSAPAVDALVPGSTQLTATWTDNGPESDSYAVYYRACPLGTESADFVAGGTEFTGTKAPAGTVIDSLSTGTQYGVVVAGVNELGQGPYGGPVFGTPT